MSEGYKYQKDDHSPRVHVQPRVFNRADSSKKFEINAFIHPDCRMNGMSTLSICCFSGQGRQPQYRAQVCQKCLCCVGRGEQQIVYLNFYSSVTSYAVIELCQYWRLATSHFPTRWRHLSIRLWKKTEMIFNQNRSIFFQQNDFENIACKMAAMSLMYHLCALFNKQSYAFFIVINVTRSVIAHIKPFDGQNIIMI